jgi:hypothetical protein
MRNQRGHSAWPFVPTACDMTLEMYRPFRPTLVVCLPRLATAVREHSLVHHGAAITVHVVTPTETPASLVEKAANRVRLCPMCVRDVRRNRMEAKALVPFVADIQRKRKVWPLWWRRQEVSVSALAKPCCGRL